MMIKWTHCHLRMMNSGIMEMRYSNTTAAHAGMTTVRAEETRKKKIPEVRRAKTALINMKQSQ